MRALRAPVKAIDTLSDSHADVLVLDTMQSTATVDPGRVGEQTGTESSDVAFADEAISA